MSYELTTDNMMQELYRDFKNAEMKLCMARILTGASGSQRTYFIERIGELRNEIPLADFEANVKEVGHLNWLHIDDFIVNQEKLLRR